MAGTYLLYNGIVIFSTIFVFFAEKTKHEGLRWLLLAGSFLIIYIPAAIRYNIGSDYWSYESLYNQYLIGDDLYIESGSKLIMFIMSELGLSAHWFFVITSFLIYFVYYLSLPKKGASLYHFTYMLTFYLTSYNLVRSAITFSFILLFLKFFILRKNNLILFLVFMCAFAFHKSAILILFIFPFLYFRTILLLESVLFRVSFILCIGVLFLSRSTVVEGLLKYGILEFFGYGHYVGSAYFSDVEFGTGMGFLINIFVVLIPVIFYCREKNKDIRFNAVVIVSVIFMVFSSVMTATIGIFSRLQTFFQYAIVLIPGYLLNYNKKYVRHILILIFFFWFLTLFEVNIYKARSDVCGGGRINPYVSIFNKEDDKSWSGIMHGDCI